MHLLLLFTLLLQLPHASTLNIATSLLWIEYTPQPYAIANFYRCTTPAAVSSGGVFNLTSNKTFDLANAETQGLKVYATIATFD
jgi:hypothetical protein